MVFFLRKLAVGSLVSSFFILMQAQAETVKPTYVRSATAIDGGGQTFALNYERFQSLDNSAHTDSLLFKFGKQKNENTNFNVIYDPLKNNNTEISYLKNYDNFNLKVKSNSAMYSKIPDYGAGIELSAIF